MGKVTEEPKNKTHKTLREKLRKKRQQLKKHKKEKRQKHKQYDQTGNKIKFYQQKFTKKQANDNDIKQSKVRKHLEKFIDIYEDDVQDFYDVFKTFDEGGAIDIADVADENVRKCLKKIFRYLPLKKKGLEYTKKEKISIKLEPVIKNFVSEAMENYLEFGTGSESQKSDSDDQKVKSDKKMKPLKLQIPSQPQNTKTETQQIQQYQQLKLYKQSPEFANNMMGPSISIDQRNQLAEMFEQQLQHQPIGPSFNQQQRDAIVNNQDDQEFNRIFSMSTTKNQAKNKSNKRGGIDQAIPEQLLAEGSARIGQKQEINMEEIEQYNKIHRPRKLIEEHQQIMKLGKYSDQNPKKRKPFDRERDIVYGGTRSKFMNNGVFFDFKEKMTQPKGTNNFL